MFQAWMGDAVVNIPGLYRVRQKFIAAAIQEGYGPHNMAEYPLFSGREANAIDAHVAPDFESEPGGGSGGGPGGEPGGGPDGVRGNEPNKEPGEDWYAGPGPSRYEKNLQLVTLVVKDDIEVVQRVWDKEKIGAWLYNMQFRSLKLCRECGVSPPIGADEEF